MGAIFKAAVPDESDQERRELERYVEFPKFCYFSIDVCTILGWWLKLHDRKASNRRHGAPKPDARK